MTTEFSIPTREEHDRLIRKLWVSCVVGALLVFAASGTTALTMWRLGYDSGSIQHVSTVVFQVILLPYGLGFVAPMLATSLIKMSLGVEMSRKGLEVAESTADTLDEIKSEVMPVVADAKAVLGDLKALVEQVKHKDFQKITEFVESLSKNGTVEALATNIKKIAERVTVAVETPAGRSRSKEDIVSEIGGLESDVRGMEDL